MAEVVGVRPFVAGEFRDGTSVQVVPDKFTGAPATEVASPRAGGEGPRYAVREMGEERLVTLGPS